jgi:hypothetical protein
VESESTSLDDAHSISASSGKWFVSATRIVEDTATRNGVLCFADDVVVSVETTELQLSPAPRLVFLAAPAAQDLTFRTLSWCRFPYRSDLLECSRFVPGRKRDRTWRDQQLEKVQESSNLDGQHDPVAQLKRELINLFDTSSARSTALFGAPLQLHRDILEDVIARPEEARRGPLNKRRVNTVVRMNELWSHTADHPDLVDASSRAARGALEFRWAVLPALTEARAPEIVPGETPDFTQAKQRVLADEPLITLANECEAGVLRVLGLHVQLHPAAKERAARIIEFAVERALCGPRNGVRPGRDPRVSALARRIAIYELHNQNRRWNKWGNEIAERRGPPPAGNPPSDPASAFVELVEDFSEARNAGLDDFIADAPLFERANWLLDKPIEPYAVVIACAALIVLLNAGVEIPRLARYLAHLDALAAEPNCSPIVTHAVHAVRQAAARAATAR